MARTPPPTNGQAPTPEEPLLLDFDLGAEQAVIIEELAAIEQRAAELRGQLQLINSIAQRAQGGLVTPPDAAISFGSEQE